MQEKSLLKAALVCSLIGILIILFISEKIELPITEIKKIDKSMMDKEVKIQGILTSITETPGLLILNIKDNTGEITVITFKEEEIELKRNTQVEIQGTVIEYKGKIEIDATSIKGF